MDWPTLIAIITVVVGLYTAISTRQKAAGEVFLAAMEAAKEAIDMRDRDAEKAQTRMQNLVQYSEYLLAWARLHCRGEERPLDYDEYMRIRK